MRGVTVRTAFHRMNFQFQPALPMRGVTSFNSMSQLPYVFQPALPMRGVTPLTIENSVII